MKFYGATVPLALSANDGMNQDDMPVEQGKDHDEKLQKMCRLHA